MGRTRIDISAEDGWDHLYTTLRDAPPETDVHLAPGRYKGSSTLSFGDDVALIGEDGVDLVYTGTEAALRIEDKQKIVIRGLNVTRTHMAAGSDDELTALVRLKNCRHVTLSDCRIDASKFSACATLINPVSECLVERCEFDNGLVFGAYIIGQNLKITGNVARANDRAGLFIGGSEIQTDLDYRPSEICHNICKNNGQFGLVISGLAAAVDHNLCHNNAGVGLIVQRDSDRPDDSDFAVTLSQNECADNDTNGIVIAGVNTTANANRCHGNAETGLMVQRYVGRFDNSDFAVTLSQNECADNDFSGIVIAGVNTTANANRCHGNNTGLWVQRETNRPDDSDFAVTLRQNECANNKQTAIGIADSDITVTGQSLWGSPVGLKVQRHTIEDRQVGIIAGIVRGENNTIHALDHAVRINSDMAHLPHDIGYTSHRLDEEGLFWNRSPGQFDPAYLPQAEQTDARGIFYLDAFARIPGSAAGFDRIWLEAPDPTPITPVNRRTGIPAHFAVSLSDDGTLVGTSKSVPQGPVGSWMADELDRRLERLRPFGTGMNENAVSIFVSPDDSDVARVQERANIRINQSTGHAASDDAPPALSKLHPNIRLASVFLAESDTAKQTSGKLLDAALLAGIPVWKARLLFLLARPSLWVGAILIAAILGLPQSPIAGWPQTLVDIFVSPEAKGLAPQIFQLALGGIGLIFFIAIGIRLLNSVLPPPLAFGDGLLSEIDDIAGRPIVSRVVKFLGAKLDRRNDPERRWTRWAAARLWKKATMPVLILDGISELSEADLNRLKALVNERPAERAIWVIIRVANRSDARTLLDQVAPIFDNANLDLWLADAPERISMFAAPDADQTDEDKTETDSNPLRELARDLGFDTLDPDNETVLNDLSDNRFNLYDLWPALVIGSAVEGRMSLTLPDTGQTVERELGMAAEAADLRALFITMARLRNGESAEQVSLEDRLDRTDLFMAGVQSGRALTQARLRAPHQPVQLQHSGRASYRQALRDRLAALWPEKSVQSTISLNDYLAFGLACGLTRCLDRLAQFSQSLKDPHIAARDWRDMMFLFSEADHIMPREDFLNLFPDVNKKLKSHLAWMDHVAGFGASELPLLDQARLYGLRQAIMPQGPDDVFNRLYTHICAAHSWVEPDLAARLAAAQIERIAYGWPDDVRDKVIRRLRRHTMQADSLVARLKKAVDPDAIENVLSDNSHLQERGLFVALNIALAAVQDENTQTNMRRRGDIFAAWLDIKSRTDDASRQRVRGFQGRERFDLAQQPEDGTTVADWIISERGRGFMTTWLASCQKIDPQGEMIPGVIHPLDNILPVVS